MVEQIQYEYSIESGAKREKDSVITLSSHPDAPVFDHEFMSPTYQRMLQRQIVHYIETRGQML